MDKSTLSGLVCLVLLIGSIPITSLAAPDINLASLYVAPSTGVVTVGSTFTVSLYLNTGGQAVNAVEANLTFPPDKLQVVSPTTGKSLIQVWVSQPTYSNTKGTLKFQGATPSPGINTNSGLISTVTFRVTKTGLATIKIEDDSKVLLNDGRGTNALGNITNGIYELILPPPAGPALTSPTNPDQTSWYQGKNTIFQWNPDSAASGYSYVLNSLPVDVPDDISEGTKTIASYEALPDGTHYFHIKAIRGGIWGGVSHYAANIDNTPPAKFDIEISPSDRTSSNRPLIYFETTDGTSGIDHFELKIIPLDPIPPEGPNSDLYNATPFFFEAYSPYSVELPDGRYNVIVRAFDKAGNFYQAEKKLSISSPIFQIIQGKGVRISNSLILTWPIIWIFALVVLLVLILFAKKIFNHHREVHLALESGVHNHPQIKEKAKNLKEKLAGYGKDFSHGQHFLVILLLATVSFFASVIPAAAGQISNSDPLSVEPPVVTLFPKAISNDEILYIGGRAGAPDAQVIIYLQEINTGSAHSYIAKTDSTGAWFFSIPQFLNAGDYVAWTQLKVAEELSPPSPKLELEVAPTAVQIGSNRLSFERLYLILLVMFLLAAIGLLLFIIYHAYHHKKKTHRLKREIKEAEEAIRYGFKILKRDIEKELELIKTAKLSREIAAEEKLREEKLLKDLEEIQAHIGEEVGDIESELK